jgi:hypothetical protein
LKKKKKKRKKEPKQYKVKWKRKKRRWFKSSHRRSCHEIPFWFLLFILLYFFGGIFCVIFPVHVFVPPRIEMCHRKLSVRVLLCSMAIGVAESIGLDTAWTIWTLYAAPR